MAHAVAVLPPSERPRSIDEKLARGLVRQEMRGLCPDGLDPALRVWLDLALQGFVRGVPRKGRVDMNSAAAYMRRVEAEAVAEPRVLRVERRSSGRTLSRRNAHEEIAVAAYKRISGLTDIGGTILHILARHAEVATNVRPLPFTFIPHLPERYLNRKGDAWEGASGIVARGLMDALPLFYLLARPGAMLPERRIALPLGEGMALGTVEIGCSWDFSASVQEGGLVDLPNVNPRFLLSPGGSALGTDMPLQFKGMTYVAPHMLRPDQERLLGTLRTLRARLRPVEAPYARMGIWPRCVGSNDVAEADDPRVRAFHDLSVEAAELLSERWAVRAMGGSDPAPGGPLEPDTPVTHAERAAAERAQEGLRMMLGGVGR